MKTLASLFGRIRFAALHQRIAVLYAALFATVLAVVLVLVDAGIERFGETSAGRDLAANARVFDEILDLRARQMRGAADVLSHDFGFRAAVATGDRETIASALRSLKTRSRASSAFVMGLDGSVVTGGDTSLSRPEKIWAFLDAGQQKGILRVGGKLALAAAAPIETPDLIGWLVIAQPLDRSEMARLSDLAAVEMQASVREAADVPSAIAGTRLGEIVEDDAVGRDLYYASALPSLEQDIEPRLVLRHSLGKALAEYANLKYALLAVALGGLAMVLALGLRLARGIAQPIARLDEAVQRFGRGEKMELLTCETEDEVGRLAESFNTMVGAIEERERQILHVGLHDGLTNLPNRRLFTEQLDQQLSRRADEERLLIAYCDLDDFKVVNDALGHPTGDEMLRRVADLLRQGLPEAQIARLGGDEFAILVSEKDPAASMIDRARIIQSCFDCKLLIEGQQVDSSASIGIAVAPGDGQDTISLLKHADLALYRAKRDGKANFHFFEPSLDEQARLRREMELDLRLAIKEGQFELYFQPLYSLSADQLKGFEALIRWNHPRRGLVSPAEFIPLAEETGLILQIGEWVIHEACRTASRWPEDLSVAVNLSPKQFVMSGLAATVLQALSQAGMSPHRLELEITESIFIADVDKTLGVLHGLRDLGVRIALDDFGTGYSSLSYLRQFPFDKVKIDQSFVRDLEEAGKNAHAVIRAITTLAGALGMETLAEGVESHEQCQILRDEGCGFVQGYLFSKPVPASAILSMLDREFGVARLTA